jgi:HTH-type transcriptional regulator/antitoxin HigA
MKIKPIKTQKDYKTALKRVEELMDAKPGTSEIDELEILSMLIEKYEEEHFPISDPDPIEAIKFRMEQLGLNQNELATIIGSKSRASEILKGKRQLSLNMIRVLHNKLNIPAEVLIKDIKTTQYVKKPRLKL